MATSTELRAMYLRYVQAFLREAVGDLADREKITEVLRTTLGTHADEHTAIGLGAALAEHWEKVLSSLLIFCDSEEKKARFIEVVSRLISEQSEELAKVFVGQPG
jgi:phenylpyruvate tautomerase PptA (4-oxalocrotonate tautomerase family)